MLNSYLLETAELLRRCSTSNLDQYMNSAISLTVQALKNNHPVLVCGNGGSASDSMHITAELVGRFLHKRQALNVICLASNSAVLTSWSNDYSYDSVFSRQVEAYGETGGCLIALSTSGNSPNVVSALKTARLKGMTTIGFTGLPDCNMSSFCDVQLSVPSSKTPMIQQIHIALYHYYCSAIEEAFLE